MRREPPVWASEEEQTLWWRFGEAKRLGFAEVDADLVATSGIDLHRLERLLVDGCPHPTAIRILL